MFVVKARAYPCDPLLGRFLALTKNIRPGWNGLPGTNAQGYCDNFYNRVVACFIAFGIFFVSVFKNFIVKLIYILVAKFLNLLY